MASRKPRPRKKHRPAEEPALPSTTTPKADHRRIPIVGIGASAGGVDALLEFFKTIPDDPGMAFIVVQHLDPTRISEMPGLLRTATSG
jgi:chemotaxis response regulator CheB